MIQNANIFIIRHAEEQKEGVELSKMGRSRAQAYSQFLAKYKDHQNDVFYFQHLISCGDILGKSIRPRQTLEPLSYALQLPLNTSYTENTPLVDALNSDPRYSNSNTLICWRHKQIIALYESIAGPALNHLYNEKTFPKTWPNSVYGWILRLNFNEAGQLTNSSSCQNLQLMYDDHKYPLSST